MDLHDNHVHPFHHPSDILPFMREFAATATRSIDIFSYQLARGLYEDKELLDAVSQLARRGAQARVRILVRDARSLQGNDHSLLTLVQRLPSRMELRVYAEGSPETQMGFFCVDAANLVHFLDEANLSGYARREARAEARQLLGEFDHLWLYGSRTDVNLRRLSL